MIKRIHPDVMRSVCGQMRPEAACHSIGINAVGVWIIATLGDGQIAVGAHGSVLPVEMLERVMQSINGIDSKDIVGMP